MYTDTKNIKNVIIVRHGRVDIPSQISDSQASDASNIHPFLHRLSSRVRRFIVSHSLFKEYKIDEAFAKLVMIVKKIQDWIRTPRNDYGKLDYELFMRLMAHEIDPPLAEMDNKINIDEIPAEIDVIYHSSSMRSLQTAKFIQEQFISRGKKAPTIKDSLAKELDEVRFSKDIIREEEFKKRGGLVGCRKIVLDKWFHGQNEVETFDKSIYRIEKLCKKLKNSKDNNILLITHGWYLRLLYMYFNEKPKSFNILKKKKYILAYGKSFQVKLGSDFSPHASFSHSKNSKFKYRGKPN